MEKLKQLNKELQTIQERLERTDFDVSEKLQNIIDDISNLVEKLACDVADIKIKAKLMENKYWLNFLTLDTTNIIHKSCLEDRITELVKIQNENRKSV